MGLAEEALALRSERAERRLRESKFVDELKTYIDELVSEFLIAAREDVARVRTDGSVFWLVRVSTGANDLDIRVLNRGDWEWVREPWPMQERPLSKAQRAQIRRGFVERLAQYGSSKS